MVVPDCAVWMVSPEDAVAATLIPLPFVEPDNGSLSTVVGIYSPYANTCTAKAKAWSLADTPDEAAAKESVPEPFVVRIWFAEPSADGSVHTRFEVIEDGALNPT